MLYHVNSYFLHIISRKSTVFTFFLRYFFFLSLLVCFFFFSLSSRFQSFHLTLLFSPLPYALSLPSLNFSLSNFFSTSSSCFPLPHHHLRGFWVLVPDPSNYSPSSAFSFRSEFKIVTGGGRLMRLDMLLDWKEIKELLEDGVITQKQVG